MDIIERIAQLVEILNKHPNLQLIDCDDAQNGYHVKVETKTPTPGKKEATRENKSFI